MEKEDFNELPLSVELKAFFLDSKENVDNAIMKYIQRMQSNHPVLGCSRMSLENYFVHKSLIVESRRLDSRLKSLLDFHLIYKEVHDGYIFYKVVKDASEDEVNKIAEEVTEIIEGNKSLKEEMNMEKKDIVWCMGHKGKIETNLVLRSMQTKKGVKHLWEGVCPQCGTKVCKMGKAM